MSRPRQCLQASRRDLAATTDADPEHSLVEARQRCIDLGQMLDRPFAEGQIALLIEDLAGRGGLRPVGHLVGHLEGPPDLLGKARALGRQPSTKRLGSSNVHPLTVRSAGRGRTSPDILPGSTTAVEEPMATETDPVCGMEVDPATSQLSLEHEGKTYWFCGRGCLLEFRDDPETYLAPDYVPSM